MKKILASKILWIVVASIVVLLVVFFPHTKRTKVSGELTGYFVTVEERYLLHNRVELNTTNVCVDTITVRVHQIDYKLNGDIKRIFYEYCDGSTKETEYADNRYIKSIEEVSFSGSALNTRTMRYNDLGLITYDEQINFGTVILRETEYDINNKIHEFNITTRQLERITYTRLEMYDDGVLVSSETNEFENNVLVTATYQEYEDFEMVLQTVKTYEDGVEMSSFAKVEGQTITTISYSSAENNESFTAICEDGDCIVDSFSNDLFEIEYFSSEDRFEMFIIEESVSIPVNYNRFIFTENQDAIDYIENLREYLTGLIPE